MYWYISKKYLIDNSEPIISLCGDDCQACPRYLAKTSEELKSVAEFWVKIGWSDHLLTEEEIKCDGCSYHKKCGYMIVPCVKQHAVFKCNQCKEYPCPKIDYFLMKANSKKELCRQACDSEEEFKLLIRAFYEKEKNIKIK